MQTVRGNCPTVLTEEYGIAAEDMKAVGEQSCWPVVKAPVEIRSWIVATVRDERVAAAGDPVHSIDGPSCAGCARPLCA